MGHCLAVGDIPGLEMSLQGTVVLEGCSHRLWPASSHGGIEQVKVVQREGAT